jgi:hypothetical protein
MTAIEVDINTSSRPMLCKLDGIGGGIADKILAKRPFSSWEDFTSRLGLSAKRRTTVLDNIQNPKAKFTAVLSVLAAESRGSLPGDDVDDFSDGYLEVLDDTESEEVGPHLAPAGDSEFSERVTTVSTEVSPKLIARWERKKELFVQFRDEGRLSTMQYYDVGLDGAYAKDYYSSIGSPPDYLQLSQLLQHKRHGGRSKVMFPLFDRYPDGTLKCIYSGRELSDCEGNLLLKCDEEHCVPQSWQASKTAHTGRDIHQMFAAWKSANGHRGNRPFGVGSALKGKSEFGKYFTLEGLSQTMFVPNINQGAVARATLYVLVAYPKSLDRARIPDASLRWLIKTASEEPTLWEKHRNLVGYQHQGNRNPFIDHPEWVPHIDFSQGFAD